MIELNSKTQQDFLNREWVQKLLDAGVDMYLDAKYMLYVGEDLSVWIIERQPKHTYAYCKPRNILPTYTVSELLYKLHEWEDKNIGDKKCRGDICFMPNAPYYMSFFHLVGDETVEIYNDMCGMSEYPIESLVMLLIQCYKKDIGMERKNTGDISDK